jgi:diaminopimelate epimerase
MKIVIADPVKNITVFVLEPVETSVERAALVKAILAEENFRAEQVGFVTPPGDSAPGLWRLDMMGGEFCGNAARSLGLYIATEQGFKGKTNVSLSVSGADEPVLVEADTEEGRAAAEMPLPLAVETLDYEGRSLPVVVFEGITHVIAPNIEAGNETFHAVKSLTEKTFSLRGEQLPAAIGVMFYDEASRFMRPAVYVRSTDSLYFESSCGSGSAALGVWLSRDMQEGSAQYALSQPGGVIETKITKKGNGITCITIGGEVQLGDTLAFPWPEDFRAIQKT